MHQLDHLRKTVDNCGLEGVLGKNGQERERSVLCRSVVSGKFLGFHFSFEIHETASSCYEAQTGRAQ